MVEPTCGDLPDPDPTSGLRRKDSTDTVKMGNSVAYECINRTLYYVRFIQTDTSGWRVGFLQCNMATALLLWSPGKIVKKTFSYNPFSPVVTNIQI